MMPNKWCAKRALGTPSSFLLSLGVTALSLFGCSDGEDETRCNLDTPGNICTIAGNTENGYSGDDGPALEARMSFPQDTLTAEDGTIYVLDWNNHRIRKIEDGVMRHVAGRGELGGTLDDPANSDFNHPTGMLFRPGEGQMIVSAWHNSKLRTLDLDTGEILDTCGDGRRSYWGDGGPALTASLDLPASIAWDPNGNLVIMDQANQVLRTIDAQGNINRLYGRCVIDAPAPSGPGPCADGVEPVACAPMGTNPSGKFTCGDPATTCGSPCTPGYTDDSVPADLMRLGQPFGQSADPGGRIAFDAEGRLYFADAGNSLIRRVNTDGSVTRIAGLPPNGYVPQRGYSGDGGPANEALLNNPVDLAIDEDGTLYFTDMFNHCVRTISPDGVIDTFAGQCGEGGYAGDGGPAAAAQLKRPYGLELLDDRLIISDSGNHLVRVVRR